MNKYRIIILGGGIVGGAIASDLCNEFEVMVVDNKLERLDHLKSYLPLRTTLFDIKEISKSDDLLNEFDLVISAVPGNMGFNTLRKIISAGKNVIDISFFNKNPFELDELAKEKNVTAIVDCGIAPGFSNLILGFHDSEMDVKEFKCFVGGLPFEKNWPFEYKAPFSPPDVIEEYVRPARFVVNGELVVKEALSDPELIYFDGIGTLEAFNTDGLRTLIQTIKAPNMVEKTLRYPGHIKLMKVFRETGFFNEEAIELNDQSVKPIEFTSKLLFKQWKLNEDEEEFTVMRIILKGNEKGKEKEYIYDIFDRYDPITKISSMARTTGYTCTSVARLLLQKDINDKGIIPPEYIGAMHGNKDKIIDMLKKKNIQINVSYN